MTSRRVIGHDLATALEGVTLVLVIDVGGGTSDFTLVEVGEDPTLRRIAVGDHLMLGGDNMDAAIARKAEEQMTARRTQTHSYAVERTAPGEPRGEGIAAVAESAGQLPSLGRRRRRPTHRRFDVREALA